MSCARLDSTQRLDPTTISDFLKERDDSDLEIGPFVKRYRRHHGLTQEQLSKQLNMSQGQLSRLETGKRRINSVEGRLQLAHQLGVDPGLFGIIDSGPDMDRSMALALARAARRLRMRGEIQYAQEILNSLALQIEALILNDVSLSNRLLQAEWMVANSHTLAELLPADRLGVAVEWAQRADGRVDDLSQREGVRLFLKDACGTQMRVAGQIDGAVLMLQQVIDEARDLHQRISSGMQLARAAGELGNGGLFYKAIRIVENGLGATDARSGLLNESSLQEIKIRGLAQLGQGVKARQLLDSMERSTMANASPQRLASLSATQIEVYARTEGWSSDLLEIAENAIQNTLRLKLPHQLHRLVLIIASTATMETPAAVDLGRLARHELQSIGLAESSRERTH